MEYEFYNEFLSDAENVDVENRELEIFNDNEFDIDIWGRIDLEAADKKYRITISEDCSPNAGRANYKLKLSEKKPLSIDEGYTNWRRVIDRTFEGYRDVSFEVELQDSLEDELPVEFEHPQETF